jgi:hypothetical protein
MCFTIATECSREVAEYGQSGAESLGEEKMGSVIRSDIEGTSFRGELDDSSLSQAIMAMLPMQVRMSRWGQEYYGSIGLGAENGPEALEVVEVGDLAYWPPGDAFCIFYGPTPASEGKEPRAYGTTPTGWS